MIMEERGMIVAPATRDQMRVHLAFLKQAKRARGPPPAALVPPVARGWVVFQAQEQLVALQEGGAGGGEGGGFDPYPQGEIARHRRDQLRGIAGRKKKELALQFSV